MYKNCANDKDSCSNFPVSCVCCLCLYRIVFSSQFPGERTCRENVKCLLKVVDDAMVVDDSMMLKVVDDAPKLFQTCLILILCLTLGSGSLSVIRRPVSVVRHPSTKVIGFV